MLFAKLPLFVSGNQIIMVGVSSRLKSMQKSNAVCFQLLFKIESYILLW